MSDNGSALRVVLISTLPPDRGNLAEYGSYLGSAISRCRGVEHVDVLANHTLQGPPREKLSDTLTVHRVWKLGAVLSILGLVVRAALLKPDVVLLNAGIRTWGTGRLANLMGAVLPSLLRLMGLRVVTTLHTISETVKLDQMRINWLTRLGLRFASWLYLRSDAVTVTLASMRRALEHRFGARNIVHVAHGTYGPRVEHAPVVAVPRILSFGFWGAFKDADLLVNAVQTLRNRGIPAELVLGGGAHPYFPEIYQRLVAKYRGLDFVRFTGYVPEDQLDQLFTSVSAVVLPYRTNAGASGVLNLCRSYGRPVVVSNDDGLVEQLHSEGGAGLIFDSQAELVDSLARILTDSELQDAMGTANLQIARKITIDTQAARIVHLFQEICGNKTGLIPELQASSAPLSLGEENG